MIMIMKKRGVALLVLMLALGGVLTACGGSATPPAATQNTQSEGSTASSQPSGEVIRVGTMPNHTGLPVQYALENGMYEEAGLNIELIFFPTGAPINEALAAEQLDLASSGTASVFALASGQCYWLGDSVKTVAGLGVYVRPDSPVLQDKGLVDGYPNVYGSAETIKGLTILGALGTSDQFEAVCWAQVFGLTGNDFQMLNMERGPAVQAFKVGEGDAIACGGPPHNYELEEAGFIEAASLTDVFGMANTDGFLGRKSFVDKRREDVKKFLEVTCQAMDVLYNNDDLTAEFAMKFYNDNGRNYTAEMMQGEIRDKDYTGKEDILSPDYRFGPTMVGIGKFYVTEGKIEPELEENIYSSMYPDLLNEIYGINIQVYQNK